MKRLIGRSKLFGGNVEPACEYCKNGLISQDKQMILCKHRGVVAPFYHCRRFSYDPTRRIPKKMRKLPAYSPGDFEL